MTAVMGTAVEHAGAGTYYDITIVGGVVVKNRETFSVCKIPHLGASISTFFLTFSALYPGALQ
jgi:hypothetical protein